MKSTAKAIMHRVKQARSAVMKVEATLAGFQFLLALGPLGIAIGLVLWVRRRRTHGDPPRVEIATPPATDVATDTTAPVATTSANAAGNGHAH
ncbi:hypothetical protein OK015_22175 [Mycobacterium sp. Aquia_216]|uniref:hypothetical protein n=1 Tax=Mycobacterium sp. Aquia_216 TaxID=2991729 RepID=UPI00227A9D54|nr:hypothetical protein [Mycobacterium sp. Aquia_216]WAJ43854.1 hypothetical protein OK015_22175 [Mycobacterium sp. Aquia_216]